jgi:hypothetical protein
MKTSLIIVSIVILSSSAALALEPTKKKPLSIRIESKEVVKSMKAGKYSVNPPPDETFILEEGLGEDFPITKVPPDVKESAIREVKKVVRPEWLPADIESSLKARRNVKLRELRDPQTGVLLSINEADILVFDYEIEGHRFCLFETGAYVTARIQLPEELDTRKDVERSYVQLVARFFTMPEAAVLPKNIRVQQNGPIFSFYRKDRSDSLEVFTRAREGGLAEWWFLLNGCSDGHFFVLSIPELPTPSSPPPSGRMGYPDRF